MHHDNGDHQSRNDSLTDQLKELTHTERLLALCEIDGVIVDIGELENPIPRSIFLDAERFKFAAKILHTVGKYKFMTAAAYVGGKVYVTQSVERDGELQYAGYVIALNEDGSQTYLLDPGTPEDAIPSCRIERHAAVQHSFAPVEMYLSQRGSDPIH